MKKSLSSYPKKAAFIESRPFVILLISTAGLRVEKINIGKMIMKMMKRAKRNP